MKLCLIFMVLWSISSAALADGSVSEKKAVRNVLDQIFDAMRAGDDETLTKLLLPDISLYRISADKPLERSDSSAWLDWVRGLKPGQADERIFNVKIHVEGPLAVAWAPFTIAIDGKLKSCGVNQFTLVKHADGWKVAYLIDTHTPQKCLPSEIKEN